MTLEGEARVYIGPPPDDGVHCGYRGCIEIDAHGVWISGSCEYIAPDNKPGEWTQLGDALSVLVPWHRVHEIEWA